MITYIRICCILFKFGFTTTHPAPSPKTIKYFNTENKATNNNNESMKKKKKRRKRSYSSKPSRHRLTKILRSNFRINTTRYLTYLFIYVFFFILLLVEKPTCVVVLIWVKLSYYKKNVFLSFFVSFFLSLTLPLSLPLSLSRSYFLSLFFFSLFFCVCMCVRVCKYVSMSFCSFHPPIFFFIMCV